MRRFAITFMAVTMAFTAAAQALAPTSASGQYGISSSVTYQKLPDGTWEYGYDIFAEGWNDYYDYVSMKFDFNGSGTVGDHIANMYDSGVPGAIPELREYWTVNGIIGNGGGDWFWGAIATGVQASYGDLATDTWITDPTPAQAISETWVIDPAYAAAEGMANPFHSPSDYGVWASNFDYYAGEGDAAFGLYPGQQGDQFTGGVANYFPDDTDLVFDMDWFRGGHMYGGIDPQLMATIRIVSDLAPYGEMTFQYYGAGTRRMGPIMGPGAPTVGNFDGDGDIDDIDIDWLAEAIRTGSTNFALFDLSGDGVTYSPDGVIDQLDLDYLVHFLVETSVGLGAEYGDFDLDGDIDTTDLTILATNFGTGTMWAEGNANADSFIDTTDLTILATNFGFVAPGPVPEPMTLSLLALGASGLLARRRQ